MGFPVHTYNRGLQLAGKPAGTVLIQLLGPVVDRNYFQAADALAHIQVFGTGGVTLEENALFVFRGENALSIAGETDTGLFNGGNTPVINKLRHAPRDVAPSNGWSLLGAEVIAIATPTARTLSPLPTFNYIQLVVSTPGTGSVAFSTDWN